MNANTTTDATGTTTTWDDDEVDGLSHFRHTAITASMYTQARHFASRQTKVGIAMAELVVTDEHDGRWVVRWSGNRGRAWTRPCRKTFRGAAAAAEALEFARAKWPTVVTWLKAAEVVRAAPIDLMNL